MGTVLRLVADEVGCQEPAELLVDHQALDRELRNASGPADAG